ncbi:DUF2278 family protein [Ralstonia pseudosolanacearum]|uniref:DUF2278 family protein n=1 Tax=Ralstonia pseudosolanacearum TaxID=1310165 RepID=UPI00048E62F5|nr:YukJ family protein [Ralstonia pseudosolanacearum]MDO3558239.1 YukJ family protein [Ralstonia pseudosolanacearum]MDO3577674.1 YukJ family protein [Ralstonia pseudosolanacearum]MDO3586873.1 YukJ family protein [Ralstonia pseudosolanacearum]
MNQYCMFKGKLQNAAPFKPQYPGSPHYVINVKGSDDTIFKIVVNSASTEIGEDGNNNVYFYADLNFTDPLTEKLGQLPYGLQTTDFPRLDYWQDRSLLLSIDTTQPPTSLPYDNGNGQPQNRDFYPPTDHDVVVYGFGFLFLPKKDGLHETHMNQGNPRGKHWGENGAFQDGAVIVQRADGFAAIFTAFQTQCLPTDARGYPLASARPLPEFIAG